MEKPYNFYPVEAFAVLQKHATEFLEKVGTKRVVLGISGGKDSTVAAAAFAKIVGPKNVFGVMMPCGVQADIDDSKRVIKELGINGLEVNIGAAFEELFDEVKFESEAAVRFDEALDFTTTKINMPPRLRMTTLYGVAQAINGIVLNTCDLSEDCCSYATLYGDCAGSYAPLQGLTVTEIIELGDCLGLPRDLVHKVPADGLQAQTDEDRLGFKYADLDLFIRKNLGTDEFKQMIHRKYLAGKFKTDMVRIPQPDYGYPNFVATYNG